MEAALRCVRPEGIDGSTVRSVAEALGVTSPATFHSRIETIQLASAVLRLRSGRLLGRQPFVTGGGSACGAVQRSNRRSRSGSRGKQIGGAGRTLSRVPNDGPGLGATDDE